MAEEQQRFNLETMSGVFPGTHTMVFQRVRLSLADGGSAAPRWARLQWYTTPAACVLTLPEPANAVEISANPADSPAQLHFDDPLQGDFRRTLRETLRHHNYRLRACGSCAHWRPQIAASGDGIPLGYCAWRGNLSTLNREIPPTLALQSMLAVDCRHWQYDGFRLEEAEPAPSAPLSSASSATPAPMPKRAEQESNERWTLWGQFRRLLAGPQSTTPPPSTTERAWEEIVVERSGVGAGTEQCHACNGRIANLGALTVATGEGDKQTFSVWRCRRCYTFYLNDWIDRWERTENLETEETYFRLAPAEALEVLAVIDNVVDAEHPSGRYERQVQRSWVLAFLAGHLPLSHQVRQGR